METRGTRRYTISIEVEIHDQDDLAHFQPDSVTATAPQLGVSWVGGSDREALRQFFDFFVRLECPDGMSLVEYGASDLLKRRGDGISAIVKRAELERDGEKGEAR